MSRPVGRPSKFSAEVGERIVTALKSGAFREVAAQWAGVSPRTMVRWMKEGKERPNSALGEFRRQVLEAETQAEIRVGLVAFQAAQKDPAYALKYLSVRWRGRWNPRHQVELTGKDGRAIETTGVGALDEATLRKLASGEGD